MGIFRRLAQLVLLDHALDDHLIDRRLDKGTLNGLTVPIPPTVVRDPGCIGSSVAAELDHGHEPALRRLPLA